MSKLHEQLYFDLKKSNKVRQLKLAIKYGYSSIEEYEQHLISEIGSIPTKPTKPKKEKVTVDEPKIESSTKKIIHIVDIIDCSQSMNGAKITAAVKGINKGIKQLKENKEDVQYTYTLCNFSDYYDVRFSYIKSDINQINIVDFRHRSMTALYTAIRETFAKIGYINNDEKVLVNIYTDGDDNNSRGSDLKFVSDEIKRLNDLNYTITFIGTNQDVDKVIRNLNIDSSNTLAYDGTGAGLERSMDVNLQSRSSYAKSVVRGESVKTGYFKGFNKK